MRGKRTRYARGTVTLSKRASESIWYFRWKDKDGKYCGIQIGSIKQFRNWGAARAESDRLQLYEKHVAPHRISKNGRTTIGQLISRYKEEKMPARFSTRHSYESWLDLHIFPRWADTFIDEIDMEEVEEWLNGLELAPKSKGHIKGLMSTLFRFAIKWKYIEIAENPIKFVDIEGGTKRRSRPKILSPEQLQALISNISEQYVQMVVIISMCLGLRFSEVLALKWLDLDWKNLAIWVRRGIVNGRVGPVKTEYSDAPGPLDPDLAELLLDWRKQAPFIGDQDWLFASPFKAGRNPYFPTAVRRKIHAAATAAGIGDLLVGEPTKILRHSYRAWLGTTGAPLAVIKDLMRHADIRTSMNEYGNGMQPAMREANTKVVKLVLGVRDTSATSK